MKPLRLILLKEGIARRAGGAERVFVILANQLVKRGYDITVLTFDNEDMESFYPLSTGIRRICISRIEVEKTLPWLPSQLIRRLVIARRAILNLNCDGLISFGDSMNIFTLWLSFLTLKKSIIADRNHPHYKNRRLRFRIERALLYPFCSSLIVQTKGVISCYPRWLRQKTTVIANPVDFRFEGIESIGNTVNSIIKRQNFRILTIAKLMPQKGLDVMVKALKKLDQQYAHWVWTVLGEGPLLKSLQDMIIQSDLQSKVYFEGVVENVGEYLKQSDLFVLSSRFEGFPNVLIEALACGVPVVSTRCPFGPEDIVQDGFNGMLVSVDNDTELSDAILKMIEDTPFRERLAQNARQSIQPFFIENVISKWDKHIQEILGD